MAGRRAGASRRRLRASACIRHLCVGRRAVARRAPAPPPDPVNDPGPAGAARPDIAASPASQLCVDCALRLLDGGRSSMCAARCRARKSGRPNEAGQCLHWCCLMRLARAVESAIPGPAAAHVCLRCRMHAQNACRQVRCPYLMQRLLQVSCLLAMSRLKTRRQAPLPTRACAPFVWAQ